MPPHHPAAPNFAEGDTAPGTPDDGKWFVFMLYVKRMMSCC